MVKKNNLAREEQQIIFGIVIPAPKVVIYSIYLNRNRDIIVVYGYEEGVVQVTNILTYKQ